MAELATIARPYARAAFETAQAAGTLAAWSVLLKRAAVAAAQPDFAVLIGTQTSAVEEERRAGTLRTTPTTRKRWASTSIVLPAAGCPPKNRSRVASLITATNRAPLSSSGVKGRPSRNSKSMSCQNSPSVRRSRDSIFLPPT